MCAQLVNIAIEQTLTGTGVRIYGGHVLVVAGTVRECPLMDAPPHPRSTRTHTDRLTHRGKTEHEHIC